MNVKKLFSNFIHQITLEESAEEIQHLAFRVLEHELGLSTTEILMEKDVDVSDDMLTKLNSIASRLNNHEPLQYILGDEEFMGRRFLVSPAVLIPRPETEELVRLVPFPPPVLTDEPPIKILDIGTGSGCIAISLKSLMPQAEVYASDISDDALAIAKRNVERLEPEVTLLKHDILKDDIPVSELDIIVSNPPYVAQHEKKSMQQHVLDHEPHLALFVPDNDPLIFYKAIATRGKRVLKPGGKVMVEIHAQLGEGTAAVFETEGYSDISLISDINGKDRFITATWKPA
ncbi:MAG TPA: peptide chain release factor N(5)-glutamine methyltransferase [Cyclobacteriaceae bacterium]|nr:peptide chain release factor N(5)-glutamine methyltransferase [Cyclobacteriaceae bacterium]HRJ82636.1 peptide chain release factor N(5)-glutamine methyltransferase [Cyclobacteriaceae bacterium]